MLSLCRASCANKALEAQGLKTALDQLHVVLFLQKARDSERLSVLYERDQCVPLEDKKEASSTPVGS
ncbi:hypothetical protein SAMN00790413_04480 [Deinococcus hopiensis KR-140]|uniref:Uncharacterized protein n=1 Tax=Deinococcus hopiensis KR-140 TaxID=695939 RepID=A0A1W1UJ40_9DEIO|nr:hypothetical protein SAMN00790413_04480 [Deinococcus hopiensis KR-140]